MKIPQRPSFSDVTTAVIPPNICPTTYCAVHADIHSELWLLSLWVIDRRDIPLLAHPSRTAFNDSQTDKGQASNQ